MLAPLVLFPRQNTLRLCRRDECRPAKGGRKHKSLANICISKYWRYSDSIGVPWGFAPGISILYFWHRAHIETKRANLVKDHDLVNVVKESDIKPEEKSAVSYLVKTSLTSKARYNSAFIVIISMLALIASIAMDLF